MIQIQKVKSIVDFLALARKLGVRLKKGPRGELRTKRGECPVCAVVNRVVPNKGYGVAAWTAGSHLDMPSRLISKIVAAADCDRDRDQSLRRQLLKLR